MAIERNEVKAAIDQIVKEYGRDATSPGERKHLVGEILAAENGVPFVDIGDGFCEPDYQNPRYLPIRAALNDNQDLLN